MLHSSKWWALISWMFPIVYLVIYGLVIYFKAKGMTGTENSPEDWQGFVKSTIDGLAALIFLVPLVSMAMAATLIHHRGRKGFGTGVTSVVFSFISTIGGIAAYFTIGSIVKNWSGLSEDNVVDTMMSKGITGIVLGAFGFLFGLIAWILQVISFAKLETEYKIQMNAAKELHEKYNPNDFSQYQNNVLWNQAPPQNIVADNNKPKAKEKKVKMSKADKEKLFEVEMEKINKLYLNEEISEAEFHKRSRALEEKLL